MVNAWPAARVTPDTRIVGPETDSDAELRLMLTWPGPDTAEGGVHPPGTVRVTVASLTAQEGAVYVKISCVGPRAGTTTGDALTVPVPSAHVTVTIGDGVTGVHGVISTDGSSPTILACDRSSASNA
jgi:hypothetical protein